MILEIADIRIKPGQQTAFEKAAQLGLSTIIAPCKGFRGHQVRHSIESPERYVLLLEWDTMEDHTVGFRESPAFAQWRVMVFAFFAQAPLTEHFELVDPAV